MKFVNELRDKYMYLLNMLQEGDETLTVWISNNNVIKTTQTQNAADLRVKITGINRYFVSSTKTTLSGK